MRYNIIRKAQNGYSSDPVDLIGGQGASSLDALQPNDDRVLQFMLSPEGQQLIQKYKSQGFNPKATSGSTLQFSKGTGVYHEDPAVTLFNTVASGATGIGNFLQNNRLKNDERMQFMKSIQPKYYSNMEAEGLNNIPAYTQAGGYGKYGVKRPYGGGPLTAEGAKQILTDGTVHGRPLTPAQKRYFGYIAGGGQPKQAGGCDDCDNEMKAGGNWIPQHLKKGRCANPGDSDCPKGSPQYNLAMTFKKHHGFHKKQTGGPVDPSDSTQYFAFNPDNTSIDPYMVDLNPQPLGIDAKGVPQIGYNFKSQLKQGMLTQAELDQYKKKFKYVPNKGEMFLADGVHKGFLPFKPDVVTKHKTGGRSVSMYQTGGDAAPAAIPRMTSSQIDYFNGFLDYVKNKGLQGSTKLNTGDLNQKLYGEYTKTNPGVDLPLTDLTRMAQNEQQVQKQFDVNFIQRKDPTKAADVAASSISPLDSFFGSETSKRYIPRAVQQNFVNGNLVQQKDLGYVPNSLNKAADTSKKQIPAWADVIETSTDGKGYYDQNGNFVKLQAGGSSVETSANGMPDEFEQFADVNAESGEVVKYQDGLINKIPDSAPSHAQGGVNLAGVSQVLENTSTRRKDPASKALALKPDDVEKLYGFRPKGTLSHADAYEEAVNQMEKKVVIFNRAKKNINASPELSQYGMNSLKLNTMQQNSLPQDSELFDIAFNHQENIKVNNSINDDGSMMAKKGGKYKTRGLYQTGGLTPYTGGNTAAGKTTPTGNSNAFNFQGGLQGFKDAWKPFLDLSNFNNAQEAQGAVYNWLVKNQPDVAASVWQSQGLTAKGRGLSKSDPNFAKVANQVFDASGKVKPGVSLTPEQLSALAPAYSDNMLGVRSVIPSQFTNTETQYPVTTPQGTPQQGRQRTPLNPNVSINPKFNTQPPNTFNEGTYWSDLAAPLTSFADSMTRDPELFNPLEFNQLHYKQLDPTNTLQANQGDFNAALEAGNNAHENTGLDQSNQANLLGLKYKANNQVLSQYDNQNAQIKNNEITYNTQVRDKNSIAAAQTRDNYYGKVLQARDNQRLQQLQAIEDLSRVDQMKRRQNRSGNLLLKMSPAFDQNGNYDGYQTDFYLPPELGVLNTLGQPTPTAKGTTSKTTTTSYFKAPDGRVYKTEVK